jgi:hypothetical protein
MLKLNASYSKKVPVDGQDYSSQSYHASVEVEIPDGLSSEQLQARIHQTFALVRDSVENELHGSIPAQQPAPAPTAPVKAPPRASGKQIQFLMDLAVRQKMDVQTLNAEAHRLFSVPDIDHLSRKQASDLIDALHARGSQRRAA